MKKILLLVGITLCTSLYSQQKINFDRASLVYDFIELSFKLDDKPIDKFHLIKFESIEATDKKGNILIDNQDAENIYKRGNIVVRYDLPKDPLKNVNAKGVVKYFKPSKENHSYFTLGKVKDVNKDVNLIDKSILAKNSGLYFGLVSVESANTTFKDFLIHKDNQKKKIDFNNYDLIVAIKRDKEHEVIPIISTIDYLDFGYDNITLEYPKIGMIYKFYKLKNGMTHEERNNIPIELFIENGESVQKIPFDFKNFQVKQ